MKTPAKISVLCVTLISAWLCAQTISCRSRPQSTPPLTTTSATTWPVTLPGFSYPSAPPPELRREKPVIDAINSACIACHEPDEHNMHLVALSSAITCVDCHGGNWQLNISTTQP